MHAKPVFSVIAGDIWRNNFRNPNFEGSLHFFGEKSTFFENDTYAKFYQNRRSTLWYVRPVVGLLSVKSREQVSVYTLTGVPARRGCVSLGHENLQNPVEGLLDSNDLTFRQLITGDAGNRVESRRRKNSFRRGTGETRE